MTVFITGGSGFFGSILKKRLLDSGYSVVSIDLLPDTHVHPNLISIVSDIRDAEVLEMLFRKHRFTCVFHVAAILAHDRQHKGILWDSNVGATVSIRKLCEKYAVPKLVAISSNCLWGQSFDHPVTEDEPPAPVELYGQSKYEAERIMLVEGPNTRVTILRCPTIMDAGRLGLMTILFDFIREGRKVWTVGGGHNRYQFIYAGDLANACIKAMESSAHGVYNIGSDNVPTLREAYQYTIDRAGTKARVASLPKGLTIAAMRLAYLLGISPLGPYHYKMIAESFVFDTQKIKRELGWQPTLTNSEMLWQAYSYYVKNLEKIQHATEASAHQKAAPMGVIRLLKWLS